MFKAHWLSYTALYLMLEANQDNTSWTTLGISTRKLTCFRFNVPSILQAFLWLDIVHRVSIIFYESRMTNNELNLHVVSMLDLSWSSWNGVVTNQIIFHFICTILHLWFWWYISYLRWIRPQANYCRCVSAASYACVVPYPYQQLDQLL